MMIPGFSRYLQAVRKLPGIISLFSLLLWSSTGVSQAQPLVEPGRHRLLHRADHPSYPGGHAQVGVGGRGIEYEDHP